MMESVQTIAGKSAADLEKQIEEILGKGGFLLIWGYSTQGEKPQQMAILSNMEGDSRLAVITSYLQAEFQGNDSKLADIFDLAAMGAVAALLKERAEDRAIHMGFKKGGGDAN